MNITYGPNGYTVTIDEYELHDLLASARQRILDELHEDPNSELLSDMCGCVDQVCIVPKNAKFNVVLTAKWEERMNGLFSLLGQYDTKIHDDAQYTC